MKIFTCTFASVLIFLIVSCNPKMYYAGFVGTWVPLDSNSFPIISRLQIERRTDFYLLGAEDTISSDQLIFFVCKATGKHLSFTPGQYNIEEYDVEYVLKQTSDIYFDRGLNCLYFLNTIYVPSENKLFEIIGDKIKIIPEKSAPEF